MTPTHAHKSQLEKKCNTEMHRETEIKTENSGSTVGLITTPGQVPLAQDNTTVQDLTTQNQFINYKSEI